MYYKNRAQQVKAFKRSAVKRMGLHLSPEQHAILWGVMRSAAFVGAAEERHRILLLVRSGLSGLELERAITKTSVLAVLGFEADEEGGAK
jgi:hypothetical protein